MLENVLLLWVCRTAAQVHSQERGWETGADRSSSI
jgi:hypothetical protein